MNSTRKFLLRNFDVFLENRRVVNGKIGQRFQVLYQSVDSFGSCLFVISRRDVQ